MKKNSSKKNPTFIDLFSGIGGTRLGFEKYGCECVFSSEINPFAQITYRENHGKTPHGDITAIHENDIPDHDILVAGFPCQPFSIAGVSKKTAWTGRMVSRIIFNFRKNEIDTECVAIFGNEKN